jgi:cytochrome c-type biogenesis protein CcmH
MSKWLLAIAMVVLALASTTQASAQASDKLEPALEARVQRITAELRCLVCQNETVAGSNADLAKDLRNQVRAQIQRGASDQEVIDYMTQRYGDFVLYRPPVKATTVLLWAGPAALMVLALTALWLTLRRRARLPDSAFEPEVTDDASDQGPKTVSEKAHS